jgi:hypothetical protein
MQGRLRQLAGTTHCFNFGFTFRATGPGCAWPARAGKETIGRI